MTNGRSPFLILTGSAKLFYQCCDELHEPKATLHMFKQAFRRRYKDVHTDQYHFTKLQTARQARNESPQQFADRCKRLAQKVMLKSDDPQNQRIHRENADRMLLASFVSGLIGVPGCEVRFSHPQSLEEALKTVVSVQEAERQERFNKSFYTPSEKSVRILSEPQSRPDSGSKNRRQSGEPRADRQARSQRHSAPANTTRAELQENRKTRTEAAIRCYECDGRGHFAREFRTRLRKEKKLSDAPGRKPPSERSKRSDVPGDKRETRIWETRTRRRG